MKQVRKRQSGPVEPVYSVTTVPQSLRDDQQARMRRYLISMSVRTACFLLAVLCLVVLQWMVLGWLLVVGAVVLPYVAVVMANAAKVRRPTTGSPVTPPVRFDRELGSADVWRSPTAPPPPEPRPR